MRQYIGKPIIEAHAQFLKDHGWDVTVSDDEAELRIYLVGLGDVMVWFEYSPDDDPMQPYDGSTSIASGSTLKVSAESPEDGTWWFEHVRDKLNELYDAERAHDPRPTAQPPDEEVACGGLAILHRKNAPQFRYQLHYIRPWNSCAQSCFCGPSEQNALNLIAEIKADGGTVFEAVEA